MYRKSDALLAFKTFKAQAERYTERSIKCVHFDQGGEYTSKEFMDYCKLEGIRVEFTNTGTPQQNGVAERMNRTIEESITSMLAEANLPPSFWTYTLSTYRHVHNRCPTSALPGNTTPFEAFKGKKPRIGHLRVFGCVAYVLISREKRRGLDGHSMPGIFVGYPDNHVGWKVYIPKTKQVVVSRDVVFDEARFPGLSLASTPQPPLQVFDHQPEPDYCETDRPEDNTVLIRPEGRSESTSGDANEFNGEEPLTPLPSDYQPMESVGDALGLVGATSESVGDIPSTVEYEQEAPHVQASRQPQPLPPPCEPSQRIRIPTHGPNAGYYDAIERQINHESPLTRELPSPPPPSPYPEALPEQPPWEVNVGDIDVHGEQEVNLVLNVHSDEALLLAGRAFVEHGADIVGYGAVHANMVWACKVGAHDTNPRSYREAMASHNAAKWHKAMVDEMNALKGNGTWRAVYLPVGRKAIGSRWVFKVKHLPNGAIERFKARVVAQGFSQRPGIDFDETFAPTA